MQTILDNANTWFFNALVDREEKLQVVIVEGIKASEREDLVIGSTSLGPSWRVEVTQKSRWISVSFASVCAFQTINESLTSADEYEIFDAGFLRVYARSRYMDFLRSHAIMEHPIVEDAQHYCLLTEDQIIDVVAVGMPEFELLQPPAG